MDNFDAKAKEWDNDFEIVARAKKVAQDIVANILSSPNLKAMEYGCGTGLLSFELQPVLGHITLIDSSKGMLEVLDQKIQANHIQNMTSKLMDFSQDDLPDEKYDLIYSLMTLHHVANVKQLLGQFHRLLNHNAVLAIADLDKDDGSYHDEEDVAHEHDGFDRADLQQTLSEIGFTDIQFSTCFEMSKNTDSGVRKYPIFLMLAKKK